MSRIATDRAVQIAAEGRKYGLYLLVSTQRPNKVHENVVSQCDNLLMMRMNSRTDLADLGRLFSFVPAGLLAGAPSFRMGQVLVAGRIFPQSGYVQMGARVSQEGGADIPLGWASTRAADRSGGSRPEAVRSRLHPQRMRPAVARGVGFRPRRDRTQ